MNALFSFMGSGDVLRIVKEEGRTPTITPVIDPDDYDSETDYINAVPGWAEEILEARNSPRSEDVDWVRPCTK
jgi:hypothetical protein